MLPALLATLQVPFCGDPFHHMQNPIKEGNLRLHTRLCTESSVARNLLHLLACKLLYLHTVIDCSMAWYVLSMHVNVCT